MAADGRLLTGARDADGVEAAGLEQVLHVARAADVGHAHAEEGRAAHEGVEVGHQAPDAQAALVGRAAEGQVVGELGAQAIEGFLQRLGAEQRLGRIGEQLRAAGGGVALDLGDAHGQVGIVAQRGVDLPAAVESGQAGGGGGALVVGALVGRGPAVEGAVGVGVEDRVEVAQPGCDAIGAGSGLGIIGIGAGRGCGCGCGFGDG